MSHDAHVRPPDSLRTLFKRWQKASAHEIECSDDILDLQCLGSRAGSGDLQPAGITDIRCSQIFRNFIDESSLQHADLSSSESVHYEVHALPGLIVYPSLLPPDVQIALLDKLLHRDLSNPDHKSNVHLHYEVPYVTTPTAVNTTSHAKSFFHADLTTTVLPKDPSIHRPFTIKHMLERKLRWVTLGGQYDWTAKVYPTDNPPEFPHDIARLLKGLFPDVDAQAAIVNLYTPGDTLSVHRDVSEDCDRGLISISIGCEGLFVIGNADGSQSATIRLRSGDVVLMSGQSRYAWHAVPKILPGTCPDWLRDWPASAESADFELWRGWMANKRINLNVRQMKG